MELNERDLFCAIGNVDEEMVESAGKSVRHKPVRVFLPVAIAACVCVAVLFLAVKLLPGFDVANRASDHSKEESFKSAGVKESGAAEVDSGKHQGDTLSPAGAPGTNHGDAELFGGSGLSSEAEDLRYVVTWDGQTYDSATGQVTLNGEPYPLRLSKDVQEHIVRMLSDLEYSGNETQGDIALEITSGGKTHRIAVSKDDTSQVGLICAELIRILESSPYYRALS